MYTEWMRRSWAQTRSAIERSYNILCKTNATYSTLFHLGTKPYLVDGEDNERNLKTGNRTCFFT